jgi:peptidoglycan/xylan/chitin deacetylase (PgdA/CDA1 family)
MRVRHFFLTATLAFAADHRVAITIDDLPAATAGGPKDYAKIRVMTEKLLKPFKDQKIPVIGFVNEGKLPAPELRKILDLWLDAGADLGNHTYSHADFSTTPLADFEQEVIRGEPVTKAALAARAKKLEYFRFPFLHTGPGLETKRAFEKFLTGRGYRNAPVTLDNADYMFAFLYPNWDPNVHPMYTYVQYMYTIVEFFENRAVEVTGHEIPQVMLLHASELNADKMPEILEMFRAKGYRFITLEEALKDPAYSLPDEYAGPGGFSWIHRWSKTMKMKSKGEPDEPAWVREEFLKRQKSP